VGKLRTDDPEEEKKQKDFKSMLNKLTPNNQEKLLQKFLAVGITQAKTLRNLIDQARCSAGQIAGRQGSGLGSGLRTSYGAGRSQLARLGSWSRVFCRLRLPESTCRLLSTVCVSLARHTLVARRRATAPKSCPELKTECGEC